MAAAFDAYVIDNEMLGAILRGVAPIEIDDENLSVDMIAETIRSEGHFLGHPQTYDRMTTGFLYLEIADRNSIEEWQACGIPKIASRAKVAAEKILATHFPVGIPAEAGRRLRKEFDIALPEERMRPS